MLITSFLNGYSHCVVVFYSKTKLFMVTLDGSWVYISLLRLIMRLSPVMLVKKAQAYPVGLCNSYLKKLNKEVKRI